MNQGWKGLHSTFLDMEFWYAGTHLMQTAESNRQKFDWDDSHTLDQTVGKLIRQE